MWKNRDTSVLDNKVVFVQGEKYAFLALINASDNKVINAWAGINSHGFAIMNSASGDLAENVKGINQNGRLMKEALGKCADGAQTFKLNDLARSLASFVYTSLQTSFPDLKDQD